MKIKSLIVAGLVALLVSTSSTTALFAQSKSKSLVVYFSRADENYGVGNITEGNTAILAKMIAQKTGSDIFEIVPEKTYPKDYRECTNVAKDEQRKKCPPSIQRRHRHKCLRHYLYRLPNLVGRSSNGMLHFPRKTQPGRQNNHPVLHPRRKRT